MRTKTERKVFFPDSIRQGVESDLAAQYAAGDWTIFDAGGIAVGQASGTTDIDVTPHDT